MNGISWGECRGVTRLIALSILCATVASCSTTGDKTKTTNKRSKEYFSEKEYGVKASPRVADGRKIPKGGGRYLVGNPYVVKGKVYKPREDKNYNKVGLASWYGSAFHGRLTANGEVYDQFHLSAAHPTFPLPSYARVTNLETGDSLIVRVNDRGPFHPGRIIDVSDKAAELLEIKRNGTAKVQVKYVGKARMDGHDMPYLMASYTKKGDRPGRFNPNGEIATGVMVASADTTVPVPTFNTTPDYEETPISATALQRTAQGPATQAFDSFENFASLPEVGPMPIERPQMYASSDSKLSAYAETRIESASAPFDAVLSDRSGPDVDVIRKAFANRLDQ